MQSLFAHAHKCQRGSGRAPGYSGPAERALKGSLSPAAAKARLQPAGDGGRFCLLLPVGGSKCLAEAKAHWRGGRSLPAAANGGRHSSPCPCHSADEEVEPERFSGPP